MASALVAAVLSLVVPGLGQIYNGQFLKGVIVFVVAAALLFTVVGYIIIWIVAVVDAYHVASSRITVDKSAMKAIRA